jgi:hypothetical protein
MLIEMKMKILRYIVLIATVSLLISCMSSNNVNPESVDDENAMMDADGNRYRTVKIGDQIWMAENLRTTRYYDGSGISPFKKG